ncbi:MAG TPA: ABC transporter substrate-binding protein [Acidimicrobiales bacterium]|nr:ABC transporter substrate-binding protein [Acidimicrobiales bacterium]
MRIVSLLPSATEILHAVGAGGEVVGVTFECDFPPEARSARVVSTSALPEGLSPAEIDAVVRRRIAAGEDLYHLDRDALAGLDPDLVVTQDLCAVCAVAVAEVDDALAYLGCRASVLTLDPMRLDEVVGSVEEVGAATGRPEEAGRLAASLHERLAALRRRLEGAPRRRVAVLEWTDPPFAAGHWVPDMVAAAGGTEVLGRAGERSETVGFDAVAAVAPDVVVVAPCGYRLAGAAGLAEKLVASGTLPPAEVWAVDADAYVVRPGPRVVDGCEILAGVLHPDRAGPADPAAVVRLA